MGDKEQTPSWLNSLSNTAPALGDLVNKLGFLIRGKLWAQILVAMVLGIATGLLVSPSGAALVPYETAEVVTGWLVLPGHIFLALIQMIMIPLVVTSIVLGIAASEDVSYLKQIGFRIAPYFVGTTTVAVGIGAGLALTIRPGRFINPDVLESTLSASSVRASDITAKATQSIPSVHDRIVDLIPTNPLGAALDESMLQIVVFAILAGIALISIRRCQAKPLTDLAGSIQQLSMEIVSWAMALAPLAVFGLLAQITMRVGLDAIVGMSVYVGTVLFGLVLLLLFYVIVVSFLSRVPARGFFSKIRDVQLLAFSTSSSAAVMPLSIKTAESELGVRSSIAQFIVPLGATINMDGTALYQVVAAIFLTQVFGVDLSTGGLLLLIATTVGASIGSPSTPGVGIVILATILQNMGVPASGIALIIGVDRILDMSRTAINVTGDLTACAVMDRWLPAPTSAEGDMQEPSSKHQHVENIPDL